MTRLLAATQIYILISMAIKADTLRLRSPEVGAVRRVYE